MPASPLVSVVLPAYNPDPLFFRECIESILGQSYRNFELIISDDSPGLETSDLLRPFDDGRIRFFRNTLGKGIFPNLNHAIRQSKGELIQIFCQDDCMYERMLEEQVGVLKKFPEAGFVYAQSDIIDETSKITDPCKYPGTPEKREILIPQQKAFNCFLRYGCLPGNLSTVMLRRSLIGEIGYFDEKFPYGGDFKYWVDATGRHEFAILLPPYVAVRSHSQQASRVMGAIRWTEDVAPVYRQLYDRIQIGSSKLRPWLYINESFGVQSFYAILRSAFSMKKPSLLKKLALLNQKPFSLPLIFGFFVVTLKRRIKFFQLKEIDLFED